MNLSNKIGSVPQLLGLAAVTLLVSTVAGTALAVEQCALVVSGKSSSALAYRSRSDGRCEGVYNQKVSGRVNLRVVGYHLNRLRADVTESKTIRLQVIANVPKQSPALTVVSLRPTDYYQMDTPAVTDNGLFDWKTDIIRQLESPPRARHLAALACTENCNGANHEPPLLHPVVFEPNAASPLMDEAVVLIMADVDLNTLRVHITVDGGEAPLVDEELGRGFLPANRAQKIIVSGLRGQTGLLVITGQTHSGRRAYYEARLWPAPVAE